MGIIAQNSSERKGHTPRRFIDRLEAASENPWPRCCAEWGRRGKFRARYPCYCALCGQPIINVRVLVHDGDEQTLYVGADCARTVLYGRKGREMPAPRPKQHEGNGRQHDYRRVFQEFGVEFKSLSGENALAEECPWCGKDRFYVEVPTGLYHCKHCAAEGNTTTYLTWLHGEYMRATKPEHFSALGKKRGGVAPQRLRAHGLAYEAPDRRWLIPFKGAEGNVVNVQLYYPDRPKGGKLPSKQNLPELPTALYGFDKLKAADTDKPVLLCEGPFDAIALDHSIGAENRGKYVIVASPGAFKETWAEHFEGRKVRAFYDNDKGGRQHTERVEKLLGESGVAAELKVLRWSDGTPDGYDVNDLVRDNPGKSVLGTLMANCYEVSRRPKLILQHGRRPAQDDKPIDWIWPNRLRCGTYASFSGRGGVFKSTIAREIAARYTTGRPMHLCDKATMPAGHVLYLYAEDDRDAVENGFELAGGDFDKLLTMPARVRDGDQLNVLDHLDELREVVRKYGVRLVIIDGQNSVVGTPNICTDMLARHNVTNRLHQFAQQENLCLLGIRNEDNEGRAYGPASMGDISRCVVRAEKVGDYEGQEYCRLVFEKVSDTARRNYPPIPYAVRDLGGSSRQILWGERMPTPDEDKAEPARKRAPVKVKRRIKVKRRKTAPSGARRGQAGRPTEGQTVSRKPLSENPIPECASGRRAGTLSASLPPTNTALKDI